MPKPRPPYLHQQVTRHGAVVWYVRRDHGPRTRIRAEYGSTEFWAQYRAALEGTPLQSKTKFKPHSLAWGLERYRNSSTWAGLSNATRRQRENIYRAVIKSAGHVPLRDITTDTIRAGRERRKETPHAANNFLKALRGFFTWAVEDGLVASDPTKGVKWLKGTNDEGFRTWTEEELDRFEARWPIGTRERLAYDLLMFTGLRRGDAVRVGCQHVRNNVISIRTEKTGQEVSIEILPPLAASIAATQTGDLAFLVSETGKPWVKESFGNWFSDVCRKTGCPGSAHGLRKAGATRAAERGATERQLMAIFGWTSGRMAQHYTRKADRKRLAQDAAHLLLRGQSTNENSLTCESGEGQNPNKLRKTGV